MTKRVVVNLCAGVKHAEGVLRGPGYVSEQLVCMVMRRDKATSRWHITEKCVCVGKAKRQKTRSGLFLDPQRPAQQVRFFAGRRPANVNISHNAFLV